MSDVKSMGYTITDVCRMTGVEEPVIFLYIEREWIRPAEPCKLDDEDLARLRLIRDLEDLGLNQEAVPVVLHLLDQLYFLRAQVKKLGAHRGGA